MRSPLDSSPTPAPVVVESAPKRPSTRPSDAPVELVARAAIARKPRLPKLALAALTLLGLLAYAAAKTSLEPRHTLQQASDLLEYASSKDFSLGQRASLLDSLVFARESAEEIQTVAAPKDEVELRREGHVSIPGGILVLPQSFHPAKDGTYDLLIHFHGNTAVVRESAEVANLNAAVAIINLGIGSAPYEEYYAVPGTYEGLLDDIDAGLARRGLAHPHLRHVALSAWSAGYGSVSTILQVRKGRDDLDAVLIFDGIHAGWEEGALNHRQLRPFADFARRAANGGDVYFGITHSAIDPVTYASTTSTADYLLASVDLNRTEQDPIKDQGAYLELESMKGAVSKKLEKKMEPTSFAKKNAFHVYGFRGETKEHHMAHLFQMGATLLPELRDRWSR